MFTINSPHQNAQEAKGPRLFLEEQQTLQLQMSLHAFFPSVEVILDRLTRGSSPHVFDFVRRFAVRGSCARKENRSESGEGEVEGKWREGVERGHPR